MASIFQTPVALITLITEDRVWFKASGRCLRRQGVTRGAECWPRPACCSHEAHWPLSPA
jgi:hypothetical protein